MHENNAKTAGYPPSGQMLADRNPSAAAVEVRALDGVVERMGSELRLIAENVDRISQFKNRLLNPRPQGVAEKNENTPPAGSVEGRLQHLVLMAHAIGERLNEVANELDRSA